MQLTNIHEILQPLPINFQSQGPAILPSRKASPKYVKANQRCWLEVQFNADIDLALFEKTIAGSPIRVIEFQNRFFIAHSGEGEQHSGGKPNRIPGRSRTAVGA